MRRTNKWAWATLATALATAVAAATAVAVVVLTGPKDASSARPDSGLPAPQTQSSRPNPPASSDVPVPPTQDEVRPSPSPTASSQWQTVDTELRQLLAAQAFWRAPPTLPVTTSSQIGLGIGAAAREKLSTLVPAGQEIPVVGDVKVGPSVRVRLVGDDNDVAIQPNDAISSGTGSDVALEFTWYVWPKHPTKALHLTAHMEVPLAEGRVWTTDLPLIERVPSRPGYVGYSFFHNATTWVGLGTAGAGLLLWLGAHLMRRGRQPRSSGAEDEPSDGKQTVALDTFVVGSRSVTVTTGSVIDLLEGAIPSRRFETVISGSDFAFVNWRYSSESAARAGHDRVVAAIRSGDPLPSSAFTLIELMDQESVPDRTRQPE